MEVTQGQRLVWQIPFEAVGPHDRCGANPLAVRNGGRRKHARSGLRRRAAGFPRIATASIESASG